MTKNEFYELYPTDRSVKELAYETFKSAEITIRTYDGGNSIDTKRRATKKEKELLTDTAIAALFAFRYSGEKRGVLDMCEFYIMRCIKDCNTYDTIYTPLRNIIGWDD